MLSTLVDAKFANMSASSAKKIFPKCKKCGTQHPGVCIVEQVALGELTVANAKKMLRYRDDESRTPRVESAVAKYKDMQPSTPSSKVI